VSTLVSVHNPYFNCHRCLNYHAPLNDNTVTQVVGLLTEAKPAKVFAISVSEVLAVASGGAPETRGGSTSKRRRFSAIVDSPTEEPESAKSVEILTVM
jgi:hypothetical protein